MGSPHPGPATPPPPASWDVGARKPLQVYLDPQLLWAYRGATFLTGTTMTVTTALLLQVFVNDAELWSRLIREAQGDGAALAERVNGLLRAKDVPDADVPQ